MNEDVSHSFGDSRLHATVRVHGAELCALHDVIAGCDLLWNGGAAWKRHSPVLFPIVGRLDNDTALFDGHACRITQHGFARDMDFRWVERTADGCVLELGDTAQSRAIFPSAFRLKIAYRIANGALSVEYHVINPDPARTLSASLGAHPAFVWPLRPDVPKDAHIIEFDQPEPENVRRVAGGLLSPDLFPTPITGRELALSEDLFAADALILDHPASHGLTYRIPNGPGLRVTWKGFRQLGLWMKPGADFLCIEPWYGMSSPQDFHGEFATKPGLFHLPPGQEWHAKWTVAPV
ncbi:aldose 1-epimerase family protein [Novacetimonas hansenii]|uniref:Aldose 1-epimerase n=2 Tax=Novacetimonas hansenii TaxID=436 RepID=A0AAW5ESX3_NOVHA|nr:aldose 1-epimerase family protein [Novacetimonas hansenii]EFG83218.1 Aldose 1-epimerase [Novacetimonas hansenii ATCC 23769]MBL7237832.1 aldose 1-epimerase family protein [Novacetimonas hansenii]MCJ8354932.1 aldose 1-epimerase family protein [Novacetimonas hansenii]GAN84078.1 hypothetical protein Gaha_0124_006 [Novacetimonas hansenii JCM 7643]GBQ61406.1 galactose mutarotase [Novacetimonas hansenii NRIC 0243]